MNGGVSPFIAYELSFWPPLPTHPQPKHLFTWSDQVQHLAYFPGITPLGITAWSGDQRLAELLLEYHAVPWVVA